MALTYTLANYGTEYSGAESFTPPRGALGQIEAVSESRIIVDGHDLDLTGAIAPATVRYEKAVWDEGGIGIVAELTRNADGDHGLSIIETDSSAAGDGAAGAAVAVSTFPTQIRGAAQSAPFTPVAGGIAILAGVKATFRAFHANAVKLSEKLQARANEGVHSPEIVAKGSAWIYYGTHLAAYMVGSNTTIGLGARLRWAAVGIAIMEAILAEDDSETLYMGIAPVDAPTAPVLLVNPATGARIAFAAAADSSDPAHVTLTPGSDGYPALPGANVLGDGAWIDGIAS